ncbi:MAG: EAL domain-containing protein, partial [Zoogloea sp.]|nr:EAL domain-containing protein [Zoogloea sp.]
GKHFSTLIHEEDLERVRHAFCERRTGLRAACNIEMRLLHREAEAADEEDCDGRWITVALNAMGIYARADGPMEERYLGTYGVCRDITERKRAEELIAFQAYHDQLTRLPNRTLFKDRLDLALAQAERRQGMLAVMFLDLDSFKLINDTYGHSVGDALLRMVAQRLKQCLRRGDTLARQGGDEFIILLPDLQRAEDAETIAHKIVEALRRPLPLTCGEFRTSVSLGISLYPRDGDSAEVLTKHADIAMYRAKQGGKNAYRLFSPDMNHVYEERMALENDLRAALERKQFELHYQPQVSLSRQAIVGMEALVRWRHPQHGLISPLRFIDVAEEVGLIHEISNWVLETGCRQLAHWHRNGFPGLRLSMNLSGRDFDHPDLVDKVATSLARHALPAASLDLEITESVLLPDTEGTVGQIRRLRDLGVGVAVDDFGTGYSSLAYLQNFPISRLKIDRSFVRDLKADGHHPIINAITGIARGFDIEVLAEGVEALEQADVLASLGCDEMQGFYFAKPLPPDQATQVLGSFPVGGKAHAH